MRQYVFPRDLKRSLQLLLGKIAVVEFLDTFQTKCQVALPDIKHKEVGLHNKYLIVHQRSIERYDVLPKYL